MILDQQEFQEYIKTSLDLFCFTGQQLKIIPAKTDPDKFKKLDIKIKFECRNKLYENSHLLDEFIKTRFDSLTADQVKIIEGFKKKIKSDFIIFRCLARHAVFIDTADDKFYAVGALSDRFEKFFPEFPTLCHTAIIPFKDKIIYDGFIQPQGLFFGKNMISGMNEKYKRAKTEKAIITTLK